MNAAVQVQGQKTSGRLLSFAGAFLALGLLAGCATSGAPPATSDQAALNDPLEPVNRAILEFNRTVDNLLLKPVVLTYKVFVPPPVRDSVHGVLVNLKSPIVLANDLLQGETGRAGETAARFAINTTIGVLGVWDPAEKWFGLPYHGEDFGQTLAVWGVGEGPFLMLPVIGPSNPRDLGGMVVDSAADPLNWYLHNINEEEWIYVRLGATLLDTRTEIGDTLDKLEKTSLDYYATLRTVYRQRRADEIKNRPTQQKPVSPSISQAADAGSEIEKTGAK